MVLPERHLTNARILTPDALSDAKTIVIPPRGHRPRPGPRPAAGRRPLRLPSWRGGGADPVGPDRPVAVVHGQPAALHGRADPARQRRRDHASLRLPPAEWTPQGFLLNGQPMTLRGLNRHQSWAIRAMPRGPSCAGTRCRDRAVRSGLQHGAHFALPAEPMVPGPLRRDRAAGLRGKSRAGSISAIRRGRIAAWRMSAR